MDPNVWQELTDTSRPLVVVILTCKHYVYVLLQAPKAVVALLFAAFSSSYSTALLLLSIFSRESPLFRKITLCSRVTRWLFRAPFLFKVGIELNKAAAAALQLCTLYTKRM